MRYGFTRAWAKGSIAVGIGFIILGLLASAAVLVFGLTRFSVPAVFEAQTLVVAIACVGFGFVLGAPEIIAGQLILIFVDQRDLLARIHRCLRGWGRRLPEMPEDEPGAHRLADRYLKR